MSQRPATAKARGERRLLDHFRAVQHGARGTFVRGGQCDLFDADAAPEVMDLPAVAAPMDVLGLQEQRERGVQVVRALLECGHRAFIAFGSLPVDAPASMPCRECDGREWSGT